MHIREAAIHEKGQWDLFVQREGGSFFHFFDWKFIYESNNWHYIPLILEDDNKSIIGIFPLVKIRFFLYSKLVSLPDGASGGFLLRQSLTDAEKQDALRLFFNYIDRYHSKGCSSFTIKENLSVEDATRTQPTPLLIQHGFSFRFDKDLKLPCTYRLPLSRAFEEDIWEGLWGKYLRNHIRKAEKQGVVIKQDPARKYQQEIIEMIQSIYEKFEEQPPSKEEIALRLTTFKNDTTIWVALLHDTPIATLVCYNFNSSLCYASKLGYTPAAREYHTMVYLISKAIGDACKNGYHFFEFGVTETEANAEWKEQFKPIKIPLRIYRKNYSLLQSFFELAPGLLRWMLKNRWYVWRNRRRLLHKMIRQKILYQINPLEE